MQYHPQHWTYDVANHALMYPAPHQPPPHSIPPHALITPHDASHFLRRDLVGAFDSQPFSGVDPPMARRSYSDVATSGAHRPAPPEIIGERHSSVKTRGPAIEQPADIGSGHPGSLTWHPAASATYRHGLHDSAVTASATTRADNHCERTRLR